MSISTELEKKIHDAIDAIVKRGEKATYEAIRAESGSSLNSIKHALESWREREDEASNDQQDDVSEADVDQTLKAQLLASFEPVVVQLMINTTKDAVEKAQAQAIEDRKKYETDTAKLESDVKAIGEYAAVIEKESDKTKQELSESVSQLKEQSQKLDATTAKNSALERDVETLTTNNLSLNTVNQELNTKLVQAHAEVQTLTDMAEKAKVKFDKLDNDHTALTDKHRQLIELSSEQKGDLKSADKTAAELRSEMAELKSKHDDYVTEIATLKAINSQLEEVIKQQKVAHDEKIKATNKTPIS